MTKNVLRFCKTEKNHTLKWFKETKIHIEGDIFVRTLCAFYIHVTLRKWTR